MFDINKFQCARVKKKHSTNIGVRELVREDQEHSLAISSFNFALMTARDPTGRGSGWSTEKGYGGRRVDGKKRRQSIGWSIDSLDRDDKNGATKRTELLAVKHPVVAWNAPECSSKSEFHLRKSQDGKMEEDKGKETRRGERRKRKEKRERERERRRSLFVA